MVDTRDSKSCANKRAGSSPVEGIYFIELKTRIYVYVQRN